MGSLLLLLLEVLPLDSVYKRLYSQEAGYNLKEKYAPRLARLTTLQQLQAYTDSLYTVRYPATTDSSLYPLLASEVVMQKFFHGYSHYALGNNSMAFLTARASVASLDAVVLPNDLVKYPYAACSQQSMVLMELLRHHGYPIRNVRFFDPKFGGHYCVETYYQGGWHFFDPDLEPNSEVLNAHKRPGIKELTADRTLLLQAYNHHDTAMVTTLLPRYTYGPVNATPARNARVFHHLTKALNYTLWIFFLGGWLWFRTRKPQTLRRSSVQTA